jgi:hypothetical protein
VARRSRTPLRSDELPRVGLSSRLSPARCSDVLRAETARQLRETLKPLSIAEQHKIMGDLGLLP